MEEIPMKRLALVLAASVLGTGCVVVDDDSCARSTFTVDWHFQRFDGSAPTGCGAAGVEWVDVFLNGAPVGSSFPCTNNSVVITDVPSGSHALTVEGIDFAGRIAYRDELTVQTNGCGNRFVASFPSEGTVNLDYTSPGCIASPCFLWFSVFDEIANTTAAAVSVTSPASVKDDYPYPNDVVIRLATGAYTLEWMQLVSASFLHEAITCSPSAFDIGVAVQTVVPTTLQASCP